MESSSVKTDVAVLGGGFAGLHAAWAASEGGAQVLLISEKRAGFSGASAVSMSVHRFAPGPKGTPENYGGYLLSAGAGVGNPDMVGEFVRRSPEVAGYLSTFMPELVVNTRYVKGASLSYFAASPAKRGGTLTRAIRGCMRSREGISFLEGASAFHLEPAGKRWRVWMVKDNRAILVDAGAVVLATGGFPALFALHSATPELLGGGLGIALRLGLKLVDLEFVQFYPYRIHSPRICDIFPDIFLHGAEYLDKDGVRFMDSFPKKELENRDVLAREIYRRGEVALSLEKCDKEFLRRESPPLFALYTRFPNATFLVRPQTHFTMGGICTDTSGFTGCDGVFAAGEVCGGTHGANRLAGHALTETVVFGRNAGNAAAEYAARVRGAGAAGLVNAPEWLPASGSDDPSLLLQEVREILWSSAGVIRNGRDLDAALAGVSEIAGRLSSMQPVSLADWVKADSAVRLSTAVLRAAAARTESRGAHYRNDFPQENGSQKGNYFHQNGDMWFENAEKSL